MKLRKKEFQKEYEELGITKYTFEELWEEYVAKIEPYLGFVSTVRTGDGRPNVDKIRKVLGVRYELFNVLKKFSFFRELLDLDNDYMKMMTRKKVIDLMNKKDPSAKDIELALKVFDDEYGNKKVSVSSLPTHLKIGIYDASLPEEELEKRANIKKEEE